VSIEMNDPTDHEDHMGDDQLREEEQPEDRLLGELARTGAEEDDIARERLDERWDRLSSGELSEQEAAELMALAEASEEGHQAFEAFRPLGEEFYQRVSDQALGALAASSTAGKPKQASEAAEPERSGAGGSRSPKPPEESSTVRRGPWIWRRLDPLPSAIAAVLIVAVGSGIWWAMASQTWPAYSVEGLTGSATLRGDENAGSECPTYRPGDAVNVVLRPRTAVDDVLGGFFRARCASSADLSDSYSLSPFSEYEMGVSEKGVASLEGIVAPRRAGFSSPCAAQPGEPEVWTICLGVVRATGDFDEAEVCARAPSTTEPAAQGKAMVLKTSLCVQRD
jgi:hypothetical protein